MNAARALLGAAHAARWTALPPLTGVAMLALIVGAVIVAPREAVEGEVQRLFYIHVPAAIAMYIAYGITFVASLVVLWRRDLRADAVARAATSVGVLFTALVLATGAIWGQPIWGVWWAWDARLTSTLVLLLLFGGYLLARSLADEHDEQAARFAAIFAVVAFLDIPIINMSVRWWRTLHPQPIVLRMPGDQALPDAMLAVLAVGVVAVVLLALWLVALRADTEQLAQRAAALRAAVDRREDA
ncbi:MAG: cytochrome C assembly protein [Chloroflexi bacterium]|nr:cytochrome C assembly protein [Chloroflexota bacterium]